MYYTYYRLKIKSQLELCNIPIYILNLYKKSMTTKRKNSVNISINKDYKVKLDRKAFALSHEVQERVTTTKVLYTLIDLYLDKVDEEIKKEY